MSSFSKPHHQSSSFKYSSCHRQKMKVLPVVRGKKLLLMILLPRLWAKWFPSPNQIVPRRRKGSRPKQRVPSPHRSVVQYPHSFSCGDRWLFASTTRPCVALHLLPWYGGVFGPFGFLHSWSWYTPRDIASRAHSLQIWFGYHFGLEEWVDEELSDMGYMAVLQQASVLKAIVLSRCLSNYRDLFNLCHLVRR